MAGSKRFLTLKNIFSPFIFITLFISSLFFGCSSGVLDEPASGGDTTEIKQAASQDKSDYESVTLSDNLILRASNGHKREITLEWDAVDGAFQYSIWSSSSPYGAGKKDGFVQSVAPFYAQKVVDRPKEDGTTVPIKEDVVSYTLTVDAGADVYYKLKAINNSGIVIATSNIARGTALATPAISISSAQNYAEVYWFMDNCTDETYKKLTNFEVTCYEDLAGEKIVGAPVSVRAGQEYKAAFYNLNPGDKYFYKVDAYLTTAQDEIESMGPVDAETAKSYIPSPVVDLVATRATSSSVLTLSWSLPDSVYIRENGEDVMRPLYFRVERADVTSNPNNPSPVYFEIAHYLGSIKKSTGTERNKLLEGEYSFDFDKGVDGRTLTNTDLGVDCLVSDSNGGTPRVFSAKRAALIKTQKISSTYKAYVPESRLTFCDTEAVRDKIYKYRVISYVDDYKSVISSIKSEATQALGYLLAPATLSDTFDYKESTAPSATGGEKITEWNVGFTLDFNERENTKDDAGLTYSAKYEYLLASRRTPFDMAGGSGAPEDWVYLKHSNKLSDFSRDMIVLYDTNNVSAITDPPCGQYEYKVFITSPGLSTLSAEDLNKIVKEDSADAANGAVTLEGGKTIYDVVKTKNLLGIANDTAALSKIRLFTIEDGFIDKFSLTFEYQETDSGLSINDYKIQYKDKDSSTWADDPDGVIKKMTAPGVKFKKTSNATFTYTDAQGVDTTVTSTTLTYTPAINPSDEGVVREYRMIVTSPMSIRTTKTPLFAGTKNEGKDAKTMGRPVPSQSTYTYDSITITWSPVQKAEITESKDGKTVEKGYIVDMHYEDAPNTNLAAGGSVAVNLTPSGKYYSFTLTKPIGYDDALRAGKKIITTVTAEGKVTNGASLKTSSTPINTYIVGPALLSLELLPPTKKSIGLKWQAVAGAAGYEIYRVGYDSFSRDAFGTVTSWDVNKIRKTRKNDIDDVFVFIYDKSQGSTNVIINGDLRDTWNAAQCLYDKATKTYTFTNNYFDSQYLPEGFADSNDDSVLGYPYRYIVVPIAESDDFFDFDYKGDVLSAEIKGIKYKNLSSKLTAMLGCGLDLGATKLDGSCKTQGDMNTQGIDIEWTPPFWATLLSGKKETESSGKSFNDVFNRYVCDDGTRNAISSMHAYVLRSDGHGSTYMASDTPAEKEAKAFSYYFTNKPSSNEGLDKWYQTLTAIHYFAVIYDNKSTVDNIPVSYETYLNDNLETRYDYPDGSTPEPKNAGYTFILKPGLFAAAPSTISGTDGKYYSEFAGLSIGAWGERGLRPTGVVVRVKNLNIDSSFHELGTIHWNKDSTVTATRSEDLKSSDDIIFEATGESDVMAKISPLSIYNKAHGNKTSDGSGTTPNLGLLKVLRDYKHYYEFAAQAEAIRIGDENITTSVSINQTADYNPIYAYRNITDEEFVRSATVIMGIGSDKSVPRHSWERSGGPKKNVNLANGDEGLSGTGSVESEFWVMTKENYEARYSNYHLNIVTKAGVLAPTQFIINGTLKGRHTGSFASSHAPDEYYNSTISVKDVITDTVTTLTFNNLQWSSGSITCNGHAFGNITPFPFHDKNDNEWFVDKDEWK